VKISLWVFLQYAWGNRNEIASHEGYADYLRRCPETYDLPAQIAKIKQTGCFTQQPGAPDLPRLPVHDKLLKKYGLDEIAGQGDAFERALRVMEWLTAHSCYNGMEIRACFLFQDRRETGDRLLRYSYDGGYRRAINCKHKAFVLRDCLMAAGISAVAVELDFHFVVHAWLPEESRWVMLDPSMNSYITDSEGRALNLTDIKQHHCEEKAMHVAQYDFNGTQDCRDIYLDSFILCGLLNLKKLEGEHYA